MIPWDYDRLDDQGGGLQFRRNKLSTWWRSTNFNYNSQQCLNPQEDGSVAGLAYATGIKKLIMTRKKAALPADPASPIECDKITRMLGNCVYDQVKQKFNTFRGQFSTAAMNSKIDAYASQIRPSVNKDSSITDYEWRQGVSSLKRYIAAAPALAPTRTATSSFGQSSFGSQSSFGGFGQSNFGGQSFGGFGGFGR